MPVNTDLLNSIISGLNSLPKKSEIDTADNDIDLLATETTHGLMSYTDKSKLNKIDEGANNYTLPIASYDVLGGIKSGNQETDSTGLEPISIIDGIPYYKPYELPIASSSVLGGIKAGDGVNISSEGILTIKSINSDNFEGVLAIEKGGTGAENKVDARKKLNTIPYVISGNITSTDETNSGYYHIFSLAQYSNNTICLKILINSKVFNPTMFDLILTSNDSVKNKPIVKLYEPNRSSVLDLLSTLYVVQSDDETSGEIQFWYKNPIANTPIKITIIQVSSLYSNDEHDVVSLSSIPNTAVDVMSTTLNNVYILKNCISISEATVDEPGYMSTIDKIKLDGIDDAINSALSGKADSLHTHTIYDISNFPTALPANGGNADTLDGLHANEISSNPNLLINPDFKINQRGNADYIAGTTGMNFTVDRWCIRENGNELHVGTDGVTVNIGPASNKVDLYQIPDPDLLTFLVGKTLTVLVSIDSVVYSKTFVWGENTAVMTLDDNIRLVVGGSETAYSNFCLRTYKDGVVYNWVKLELGPIATRFIPPDPATELLKCMRYYEVIMAAQCDRAIPATMHPVSTVVEFDIQFKVPKRVIPTLVSTDMRIVVSTSTEYIVADCKIQQYAPGTDIYGMTILTTDGVLSELPSYFFGVTVDTLTKDVLAVDAEIYLM